jgi:hypothetical protein
MSGAVLARKREVPATTPAGAAAKATSGSFRIGEPNDAFEQEADHVADAIMTGHQSGPQGSLSRGNVGSPRSATGKARDACASGKVKAIVKGHR